MLWLDCPDPAKLEDRLAGMRGRGKAGTMKFRPWPDLMAGADPRSAALHRNRLQEDANVSFAREAMAKGELVVGRDDAALQATLTEIYRKSRADQQEGGSNTLFLTIGTLLWNQKDRRRRYRAPLILVPVVLERPSVRSGFVLRVHDDETRLNSTLLEMLRQEFALRFPTLEAERPPEDEAGFDVPAIMDTFRSKAARHQRLGGSGRGGADHPVVHQVPDVEGPGGPGGSAARQRGVAPTDGRTGARKRRGRAAVSRDTKPVAHWTTCWPRPTCSALWRGIHRSSRRWRGRPPARASC